MYGTPAQSFGSNNPLWGAATPGGTPAAHLDPEDFTFNRVEPAGVMSSPPPIPPVRRSARVSKPNSAFDPTVYDTGRGKRKATTEATCFMASASTPNIPSDPKTYGEAMSSPEAHHWQRAMDEEMESQNNNHTWIPGLLPPGKKALPVRWIFTRKRNELGEVVRYKARLVVKGFMQREGVDFKEVFSPTAKWATMRTFLSLTAALNLELEQLDVKTAFLHAPLEEDIWISQPPGFEEGGPRTACKLLKAVYGLKQAPRAWHIKVKSLLMDAGYTPSAVDPALFVKLDPRPSYCLVWVDDLLVAYHPEDPTGNAAIKRLEEEFEVTKGDGSYYLGVEIKRNRALRQLKISQHLLIEDLLAEFGMSDCKPKSTPFPPGTHPTKTGAEPLPADSRYSALVGSLLYLSTVTRPDIAQAVGVLSRYMAAPTQEHWQLGMHLLRYLSSTRTSGITYTGTDFTNGCTAIGYTDSDFAGDLDTRRSTTGYVFTMNGGCISWSSRLQPTVAVSTTEAEYMAAGSGVKEALWLRNLHSDMGMTVKTVTIYTDNQASLAMLKNPVSSVRTKHIDVLHHFARERVERKEVCFVYISTSDNISDIMTKALPSVKFVECCTNMGVA